MAKPEPKVKLNIRSGQANPAMKMAWQKFWGKVIQGAKNG